MPKVNIKQYGIAPNSMMSTAAQGLLHSHLKVLESGHGELAQLSPGLLRGLDFEGLQLRHLITLGSHRKGLQNTFFLVKAHFKGRLFLPPPFCHLISWADSAS